MEPAPVWTEPVSRWATLGAPTHFADFGGAPGGPLVICVHGLGGSYRNWIGLAPLLTPVARVLAIDLAGHGRTPPTGHGADVRSNRRLLHRFLTEVAGGPAILVGNSMGGLISVLEAAAGPAGGPAGPRGGRAAGAAAAPSPLVAGIVLLDPALPRPRGVRPDPEIARMFAAIAVPGLGEYLLARQHRLLSPERQVRGTISRCAGDPATVPAEVVAAHVALLRERTDHREIDRAQLGSTRSLLMMLARARPINRAVRRVAAPTMLIHGEADRLIPVPAARQVARARPDWRVEIRPGVGHIPQMEDAPGTAALILDWFGREGRAAVQAARATVGPVTEAA
jgi:pimeloyl-ACP methyl ester carboxylesterase